MTQPAHQFSGLAGLTVVELSFSPGPWYGGVWAPDVVTYVFLAKDTYVERMRLLATLLNTDHGLVRTILETAASGDSRFWYVRRQIIDDISLSAQHPGDFRPLSKLLADDSFLIIEEPHQRFIDRLRNLFNGGLFKNSGIEWADSRSRPT